MANLYDPHAVCEYLRKRVGYASQVAFRKYTVKRAEYTPHTALEYVQKCAGYTDLADSMEKTFIELSVKFRVNRVVRVQKGLSQ